MPHCSSSETFCWSMSPTFFHTSSECKAGNAKRYVNLYFLRSAKQTTEKDARSEGHEYIDPSLMASQIYFWVSDLISDHGEPLERQAYCASSLSQYCGLIKATVLLNGVYIADHALSATISCRYAAHEQLAVAHRKQLDPRTRPRSARWHGSAGDTTHWARRLA